MEQTITLSALIQCGAIIMGIWGFYKIVMEIIKAITTRHDREQAWDKAVKDIEVDREAVTAIQNVIPSSATSTNKLATASDIPTVNNGQLTIQQNGTNKATFTANQSSGATANIVTDDWVKIASVSSGSVTFSGIDDSSNYGYEVFFEITSSSTNKNPSAQLSAISGEGTANMSLTYTTDADNGTNNAKLRRIK